MPRGKKKIEPKVEVKVEKKVIKKESVLEPNKIGTEFCKHFGCYTNRNETGYCDRHARKR